MAVVDTAFPTPNDVQFEQLILELAQAVFAPSPPAQLVGRTGQKQQGVDILFKANDGRWIGIQCKRYLKGKLTAAVILKDLAAAHEILPPIDLFIVATRADRDAQLQTAARLMTLHGESDRVVIWSWAEITLLLEQHNLISRLLEGIPSKHLLQAAKDQIGEPYFSLLVSSMSQQPGVGDPPWLADVNSLLAAAKPVSAEMLLDAVAPLERASATFGVARLRSLISNDRFVDALRFLEGRESPSGYEIALGSLAAALTGDAGRSNQLIDRAKLASTARDRANVFALSICVAGRLSNDSYEDVLESTPPDLRDTKQVAMALGDLACSRGKELDAIDWYDKAERADDKKSLTRSLARASAIIGLARRRLPLGALILSDKTTRELAEEGVRSLMAIVANIESIESKDAKAAALSNLAVGLSITGDAIDAEVHARAALELSPEDVDMWRRYLSLLLAHGLPWKTLMHATPDVPDLHLRLGILLRRSGDIEAAKVQLEKVTRAQGIDEKLREAAEIETFEIDSAGTLSDEVARDLAGRIRTGSANAGFGLFLIRHIDDPGVVAARDDVLESIGSLANRDTVPVEEKILIAGVLRDSGYLATALAFVDPVRNGLNESVSFDPTIAELLIDLLIGCGRFREAKSIVDRWHNSAPKSRRCLAARTNVLAARGLNEQVWEVLDRALMEGVVSANILSNYTRASLFIGKLREGRKRVRQTRLPSVSSPHSFKAIFFALSVFHDTRLSELMTEGLKPGTIDASTATSLFWLGIRRFRREIPRVVGASTLVRISTDGRSDLTVWIGDAPSPMAAVVQVPVSGWVAPLVGRTAGDVVDLDDGPFRGRTVRIERVASKTHLFIEFSRDFAKGVGLADGGVEEINAPDVHDLVAEMRASLKKSTAQMDSSLKLLREAGFSAALVGAFLDRPARYLIRRQGAWRPTTHLGTPEAISRDDGVLRDSNSFVLDATAVMTIVEIGAEPLLQGREAILTPQTMAVLRQNYLIERESLKSTATAGLAPRGRIRLHENSSLQRRQQIAYWKRVKKFVAACDVLECTDDESYATSTRDASHLDVSLISSVALCLERGLSILSEERLVRLVAAQKGVAKCGSIQRLIIMRVAQLRLPVLVATRCLATLASLGGYFTVVPSILMLCALRLSDQERKFALKALLGCCREANPYTAVPILGDLYLLALHQAQVDRSKTVSIRWLRREIARALPLGVRTDERASAAAREYLGQLFDSRRGRSLRRALFRLAA